MPNRLLRKCLSIKPPERYKKFKLSKAIKDKYFTKKSSYKYQPTFTVSITVSRIKNNIFGVVADSGVVQLLRKVLSGWAAPGI
uniref:CSON011447 protein n=1 Tax=Culicoides sonorensis TaxID=179676 RepID=A0A336LU85_CULSO